MTLGDRIRFFRRKIGMTQRELGMAMGFSPLTAEVRVSQYENGSRRPKPGALATLASVFGVAPAAMEIPDIEDSAKLMQTLFAMEDCYALKPIRIYGETFLCIDTLDALHVDQMKVMLNEWQQQLARMERNEITQEEYDFWRYNYSKI